MINTECKANVVLTIAGSEATGGAGATADIKTFQALNVAAAAAITCIVTMDAANGWSHKVTPISPEIISAQILSAQACYDLDTVKIGMLGTPEAIEVTEFALREQAWKNIVLDPVLICKGQENSEALQTDKILKKLLLPLATVVTPNIFEAQQLAEMDKISTVAQMVEAAKKIYLLGPKNVVIKGGVNITGSQAVDIMYDGEETYILEHEKIGNKRIHGAGCTLAAAIAAQLCKGMISSEAVKTAKKFTHDAIRKKISSNAPFETVLQCNVEK